MASALGQAAANENPGQLQASAEDTATTESHTPPNALSLHDALPLRAQGDLAGALASCRQQQAIAERLGLRGHRGWLRLPAAAGALRARLFAGGAVREERTDDDGAMRLLIELPAAAMAAMARNPGVILTLLPAELPCAHA
mgnify:CR=1 FL=1